jgi:acyl carrier protein
MSYEANRQAVVDWLDDNYHFGDAAKLIRSDDLSFLDNGILDSLGFVQLVLHLEKTFKVKIERKHLNRENFDSLRKIVSYVMAHKDYKGPR